MKDLKNLLPTVVAAILLCACNGTPSHVIPTSTMAQLMADIYMGDAVIEDDYRSWGSDSSRLVLKQSIYDRYGVTVQQVDTSLQWYGHNLQKYMEVCAETERILQERIDRVEMDGSRSDKAPRQASVDGDSVNVWRGSRLRRNYSTQPSDYMLFSLNSDRNWERGDRYSLNVKGVGTGAPLRLDMGVDYNDGTSEYCTLTVTEPMQMNNLRLVLDSAKVATVVYGSIHYQPLSNEVSYLDSISLVRTRGRNDNVEARKGQITLDSNR